MAYWAHRGSRKGREAHLAFLVDSEGLEFVGQT